MQATAGNGAEASTRILETRGLLQWTHYTGTWQLYKDPTASRHSPVANTLVVLLICPITTLLISIGKIGKIRKN